MDGIFDYIALIICIGTLAANLILNVGIITAPIIDGVLRRRRFAVIISLAVADLLKIVPLISEIGFLSYQQETCRALASVGLYLICVTILHLVLESINRLVAIVRPLRYGELLTNKLLVSLLASLWFLPILGIILPLAVYNDVSDWEPSFRVMMFNCDQFQDMPERDNMTQEMAGFDEKILNVHYEPASNSIIVYSAIITIVYFAIPLITMVVAYSVIFHISLKHIKQIKGMEKNMRQLYHRISRSNLVSKNISEISTTTQVYENDFESRKHNNNSGKAVKIDVLPSVQSNKTEDSIHPMDNDNCEGLSNKLNDRDVNRKEFSVINMEKNGITNTKISIKQLVGHDGGISKKVNNKKDDRRRKAGNVVHPQDNSKEFGWNTDEPVEQFKIDYANFSTDLSYINGSSEKMTKDKGEVTEAVLNTSKKRLHNVIPVQAEDIMASHYDSVVDGILNMDIGVDGDAKSTVKVKDDAIIQGLSMSGAQDIAVCNTEQTVDETSEALPEDPGENKNKNTRKARVNFPLNLVHERPPGMEKNKAWPKLWQKVAIKSNDADSRDGNEERIPSESAFIKIIESVEKKSMHSQQSFGVNAKRVMRFSAFFRGHLRRHGTEDDADIGERPTHAEVNHMESLLSIAENRHNDQVTSALNKTIQNCGSESEDQTIDAFSLLTAFPVMEAWANSLKAKATPQSNSFVRFYRVIRGEMRNRKKEGKLVKTLGLLFMTWILFYIPAVAFSWSRLLEWPSFANDHGSSKLLISWALLSSAFNPIIYCLRIPDFKKTFRKIFKTIKLHIYCS